MSTWKGTVTVHEELQLGDEFFEFHFDVPVTLWSSKGQTDDYGRKLEPDDHGLEISGDIEIRTPLHEMARRNGNRLEPLNAEQFVKFFGDEARRALREIREDDTDLHETACERAEEDYIDAQLAGGCMK